MDFLDSILGGLFSPAPGGGGGGSVAVAQASQSTNVRVGSEFKIDWKGALVLGAVGITVAILAFRR